MQRLILSELKEFRQEVSDFTHGTAERLSRLETQVHPLVDNGRPGRISRIENELQKLLNWRWWVLGLGAGSGAVISVVGWAITVVKK